MSEDRPLTEFVGDADDAKATADASTDHDADAADASAAVDTEPTTPTYRWWPDGATCGNCGATTERQWRDDGQFVCPDCKSW